MTPIADYDDSNKTRVSVWEARDIFPLRKRKPRVLKKLMQRFLSNWKANSNYKKVHLVFWEEVVAHGIAIGESYFVNVDGSVRHYTTRDWPLPRDNAGLSKMVTRNFFDKEG